MKKISYANLVGTYLSQDELDTRVKFVKASGYSPYIIEEEDNLFRLFVGGFFTEIGARRQFRELESDGISAELVKR